MSQPNPTYFVWTEEDGTWAESEARWDLPPLNPNQPVPVVLTAEEWAAISVASRMYSYADGADAVTGMEHKRVRAILTALMERRS